MSVEFLGYIAGMCTAVCFLPQTLKIIFHKQVQGLSLLSYTIYTMGLTLWDIYGFCTGSMPMIIFNTIAAVFGLIIMYMIVRYQKKI